MTSPDTFTDDLCTFLDASPSSFHAAQNAVTKLANSGFHVVDEADLWQLTPGKYVTQRDGAFIAWVLPPDYDPSVPHTFMIVGAHTDSPALKLKPSITSTSADGHEYVDVEPYGGFVPNAWLNREMGLAGVVVDRDGNRHLTSTNGPVMIIPQLAIHLDRTQRESLKLSAQHHLHPIAAIPGQTSNLANTLARNAGLSQADDIAGMDIYSYDTHQATRLGVDNLMVAAARQDNLLSVFSALMAIDDIRPADHTIALVACFDHEEVGSHTRSGAAGSFLEDVIARLVDEPVRGASIARSACLSVDVAHAINPNYADKHDPETHPLLGHGPVLKVNANQRYSTDAAGEALWARACAAASVTPQRFVSNNDVTCGSTIAPMMSTRLGIRTVDVGVPIWSMHSLREVSHGGDSLAMARVMSAFLSL